MKRGTFEEFMADEFAAEHSTPPLAQTWAAHQPSVVDIWRARGRFEVSTGLSLATSSPQAFRHLHWIRTAKRWALTGLGAAALGGLAWLMFPGDEVVVESRAAESEQAVVVAQLGARVSDSNQIAPSEASEPAVGDEADDVIELTIDDLEEAEPPKASRANQPTPRVAKLAAEDHDREAEAVSPGSEPDAAAPRTASPAKPNERSADAKSPSGGSAASDRAAIQARERSAWERAAGALRKGSHADADSAFNELMSSVDASTRDAAELARAQLWLSQGRTISAQLSLTRLAREGATPLIRRRAWRSLQELTK